MTLIIVVKDPWKKLSPSTNIYHSFMIQRTEILKKEQMYYRFSKQWSQKIELDSLYFNLTCFDH